MDSSPSRRALLRAGAAAGSAAALSGCFGLFGDGGNGDDAGTPSAPDGPRIGYVPSGVTALAYADLQAMLADESLREGINRLVADLGEGVPDLTVEEALDEVQRRSGLDPRRVNELLAFGSADTGEGALVVWTDFPENAVATKLETLRDADERTYGGYTVYASGNDSQLAVLGDGRYVLGTRGAVESVIDLRNGDASPVTGEVRTGYAAARGGYVRFAFDVPTERLPSSGAAAAARHVEYGYGSLYRVDSSLMVRVSARTETEESAISLHDGLEDGLAVAGDELGQVDRRRLRSRLERIISKTEVTRDGRTVTLRNPEGGVAIATVVAAVAATFVLGLGTGSVPVPQARFEFEYDRGAERLTITHAGGDTIPAPQLSVTGDGVDGTGTWRALDGQATGDVGGQPAVQAGDSLTVGASPGYTVKVVWTAPDGSRSQTLASDVGPGS